MSDEKDDEIIISPISERNLKINI